MNDTLMKKMEQYYQFRLWILKGAKVKDGDI